MNSLYKKQSLVQLSIEGCKVLFISSNTMGNFSSKSILYTSAMILFTNSNIFICPCSPSKKIVLMKCNSEKFGHRNMFNKYDWYLKCLSLVKYASWKWIVVAKNSLKPKQQTWFVSGSVKFVFNKKPIITSLIDLSSSYPNIWLNIDNTSWTSSRKRQTSMGKVGLSTTLPAFGIPVKKA